MVKKIPCIKLEQNGVELFLGKVKMEDLLNRTAVDVWKSTNEDGYQREATDTRAKSFGRYIEKTKGISPNTVLLNVRDKNGAMYDGEYLTLEDDVKFWVIDGQHRIKGLQYSIESGASSLLDFEVPVIITTMNDKYEEAKQFAIINRTQKGVRPDLAERFLQKAIKREGKDKIHAQADKRVLSELFRGYEWRPKALEITDILNNQKDSIWLDMIRLPNEPKGNTIISQKTFMDSLEPILKDPYFGSKNKETLSALLKNYWSAIDKVWPEILEEPRNYVLYKLTGVMTMHRIFLTVSTFVTDSSGKKNFTTENLYKILLKLVDMGVGSEFWASKGEAGKYGTNQKGIKLLCEDIDDMLSGNEASNQGDLVL